MQYGYIIRDEKIADSVDNKNEVYKIKAEGERVAKGQDIFRYYSTNEELINKKIEELNSKIQEAMVRKN